jgi:hypothetical protein
LQLGEDRKGLQDVVSGVSMVLLKHIVLNEVLMEGTVLMVVTLSLQLYQAN